jgi:hypothetical protein
LSLSKFLNFDFNADSDPASKNYANPVLNPGVCPLIDGYICLLLKHPFSCFFKAAVPRWAALAVRSITSDPFLRTGM